MGEMFVLNFVLFDRERDFEYDDDGVTNLGCECDRRRGLDEK